MQSVLDGDIHSKCGAFQRYLAREIHGDFLCLSILLKNRFSKQALISEIALGISGINMPALKTNLSPF